MTDSITIIKTAALASLSAALDQIKGLGAGIVDIQATLGDVGDAVASIVPPAALTLTLRSLVADPTGNGDTTADVQQIFDKGGLVYVPRGRYLIDPLQHANLRTGLFVLCHPEAYFIAKPNAATRSYILYGVDITDFAVIGGNFVGDRIAHTYVGGSTSEWNHGIGLTRCQRGTIRDVTVRECAGDGASINGQDLEVIGMVSQYNRRQGLTIGSGARIRVIGGEFSHTGPMGTSLGTKPMAGIDCEPDGGTLEDVTIDGITAIANGTSDVLVYSNTSALARIRNVRVQNCKLMSSPNGLEANGAGGVVEVFATRNTAIGHKGAAFKVGPNATVNIGSTDAADANTITGMAARNPLAFQLQGTDTRTKYDIQVAAGGKAVVGINNYASPAP